MNSMLSCRKYHEQRKAMANKKVRDFFAWTDDEVELLLKVTRQYKAAMAVENIDWESSQSKYSDIFELYRQHYPSPEEAMAMGKEFPHKKDEITKDGWCKSLVEDAQSEEERQHNSAPGGPFITAVMHTDPSEESGVPLIVGGVKEENGEEFMYSGERTDGQREIKAETGNSSRPLSAPAASSPDIKPDIVRKTKDNESVSNHNANLSISPVPLLSVTDTSFAGDMIADWEKEDFETKHCGKEKEWEREEHLDMSSSEASVQSIATVNFRDVISDRVTTQQGIKEERIEAMSPSTEPLSVLGDCQYDNPGHTDATSLGHDATQLQVMKLETRDPQTTQVSDSIYSSVMEEGPSSRLSANINLDTMDLDQLKREKIKMQLKVLKLQEEYYTRKLKEFKK